MGGDAGAGSQRGSVKSPLLKESRRSAFFGKVDVKDQAGLHQGAGSSQSAGPGASLRAQMLKEQKEPQGSEQENNSGGPACGSAGTYQGTGA